MSFNEHLFNHRGYLTQADLDVFLFCHGRQLLEPFLSKFSIPRHVLKSALAFSSILNIVKLRPKPAATSLVFMIDEIYDTLKERMEVSLATYAEGAIDYPGLLTEFFTQLLLLLNVEVLPHDLKAYYRLNYTGVDYNSLNKRQQRLYKYVVRMIQSESSNPNPVADTCTSDDACLNCGS